MSTFSPSDVRALFPAAQRASYLNAAASSPIALPVEKAIADHYREAVETGDLHFDAWLRRREEVRARVARFIGAATRDVAFVGSTSWGIHLAARLLQQRGVSEVLTLEGEFPSTTVPFLHLGFQLRVVRRRGDGTFCLEDIAAAVGPHTGAIAASAVQYATGFRLDLAGVSRLCRDQGLAFVVNAAQALGQVPIEVEAIGADFLCAPSHKWLMGGYGVGLFYARPEMLDEVDLPVAGWLSVDKPWAMDALAGARISPGEGEQWFEARGVAVRRETSALEIGSHAFGPIFGVGAALEILEGVGIAEIERHNAALQKLLRAGLRERGFRPNAPDDPARSAGICGFGAEGKPSSISRELARNGVFVSARGGGLRVSTHVFNTEEDVRRLLDALDALGIRPSGTSA
jgi:cysteine desulfurase / selenocysteine lyase